MRSPFAILVIGGTLLMMPAQSASQNAIPTEFTNVSPTLKVKMLSIVERKPSTTPLQEQPSGYVYFDTCGRVKTIRQLDGNETAAHTYCYNSSGQLTQHRVRYTVAEETVRMETTCYSYNNDLLHEETSRYAYLKPYGAEQESKVTYHYNGSRLLAKHTVSNGELILIVSYQYDSDGRLSNERCFTPQGTQTQLVSYTYSEQGLLLSKSIYDRWQTLAYEETYSYSPSGQLAEQASKDLYQKTETKQCYYYNTQGLLQEATTASTAKPNKLQRVCYSYDQYGSWLSQTTYLDQQEQYSVNRLLTYEQETLAEK